MGGEIYHNRTALVIDISLLVIHILLKRSLQQMLDIAEMSG